MRLKMTTDSRTQLVESLRPEYAAAPWKEKNQILNGVVAATGYNRKYAIQLLVGYQPAPSSTRHRAKTYNDQIHAHLKVLWLASNRVCSKRLVALIPTLLPILESHEYLEVCDFERNQLLQISAASIDRILKEDRKQYGPKKRNPSHRSKLRKQIPIRTAWHDPAAGFCEIDLVTHGGQSAAGRFLHTLTLTDIATGWTENRAILHKTEKNTLSAIQEATADFPVPILGFDCDNGVEFLNHLLDNHCKTAGIELTRSRPYRKNDQAHVEQKNGAIVRRIVGYDRFEGEHSFELLRRLYTVSRLYHNYFQPNFKLIAKERIGSKVKKVYDAPATPYQRMLNNSLVIETTKQALPAIYKKLDPIHLLESMKRYQSELWKTALVDVDAHVLEIATPTLSRPKRPAKKAPRRPLPHRRRGPKRNFDFERKIASELERNPALGLNSLESILYRHYGKQVFSKQTVMRRMNEWRDVHPEYAHLYPEANKRSIRTNSVLTG